MMMLQQEQEELYWRVVRELDKNIQSDCCLERIQELLLESPPSRRRRRDLFELDGRTSYPYHEEEEELYRTDVSAALLALMVQHATEKGASQSICSFLKCRLAVAEPLTIGQLKAATSCRKEEEDTESLRLYGQICDELDAAVFVPLSLSKIEELLSQVGSASCLTRIFFEGWSTRRCSDELVGVSCRPPLIHRVCAHGGTLEVVELFTGYCRSLPGPSPLLAQADVVLDPHQVFQGTPLHVACCVGNNLDLIRYLVLVCPEALSARNHLLQTPLHVALASNSSNEDIIQFLIDHQKDEVLSLRDAYGSTPLHVALNHATAQTCPWLLRHLACRYEDALKLKGGGLAELPLHIVWRRLNVIPLQVLDYLTELYPQAALSLPMTALHRACDICNHAQEEFCNSIATLVKFRPKSIQSVDPLTGGTPLHVACRRRQASSFVLIQFLAKRYPHALSVQDNNGDTPLHVFCSQGASWHFHVIQLFVDLAPATLELRNKQGHSPLVAALECFGRGEGSAPRLRIVEILAEAAPSEARRADQYGLTPLYFVVKYKEAAQLIPLLLNYCPRAAMESVNQNLGQTLLHCLCDWHVNVGRGMLHDTIRQAVECSPVATLVACKLGSNDPRIPLEVVGSGSALRAFLREPTLDATCALILAVRNSKTSLPASVMDHVEAFLDENNLVSTVPEKKLCKDFTLLPGIEATQDWMRHSTSLSFAAKLRSRMSSLASDKLLRFLHCECLQLLLKAQRLPEEFTDEYRSRSLFSNLVNGFVELNQRTIPAEQMGRPLSSMAVLEQLAKNPDMTWIHLIENPALFLGRKRPEASLRHERPPRPVARTTSTTLPASSCASVGPRAVTPPGSPFRTKSSMYQHQSRNHGLAQRGAASRHQCRTVTRGS